MFFTCSIPVHRMFLTCSLPVYFLFLRLLRSDLYKLFEYSTRRSEQNLRSVHKDFMSDLYDSELYKNIAEMVNRRARIEGAHLGLIVLYFSADGYNLFETNNRSLWPFSYFIASLPPKLRHLMHVGIRIYLLRTCFVPVHFLYCICSFTVLFLYCTCSFTVLYLFTTCF